MLCYICTSLKWRLNGCDGVSIHLPHHYLLNRLFRHSSKKTSKFRIAGLCAGNSPVTGEFPAQKASNAENVSIWWRHHANVFSRWLVNCSATERTGSWSSLGLSVLVYYIISLSFTLSSPDNERFANCSLEIEFPLKLFQVPDMLCDSTKHSSQDINFNLEPQGCYKDGMRCGLLWMPIFFCLRK